MPLEPPLVRVVRGLDAPWKIVVDRNNYKTLLIREGVPMSAHVASVYNDLRQERCRTVRARRARRVISPIPAQSTTTPYRSVAASKVTYDVAHCLAGGIDPDAEHTSTPRFGVWLYPAGTDEPS